MTERRTSTTRTRSRVCFALSLAALALGLAACTSAQVRDGSRFWGDHARAVIFGDDPARD